MSLKSVIPTLVVLAFAPILTANTDIVTTGEFVKIYDPSFGESSDWYINDHCFIYGSDNKWHMFGITHAEPLDPADEDNFAHATADVFTQTPWKKQPYALTADESLGESHLWAPHVIEYQNKYYMYYCAGGPNSQNYHINLAVSKDLYNWTRHPENPMFIDGFDARDPFILKDGNRWIMYYTATDKPEGGHHIVAARTSYNLVEWSEKTTVFTDPAEGTFGGPTESPTVIRRGKYYYLFIGPRDDYRGTSVYQSTDPFNWDIENIVGKINSHAAEVIRDGDGKLYVSHCGWGQGGVYLAPLYFNDGVDDEDGTSLIRPCIKTLQKQTPASVFKDFVTAKDGQLIGDSGKELRFISYNIPCLHYNEDNMKFTETNPWRLTNEFEISDALEAVSRSGGQVVRTYTLSVKAKGESSDIPRHVIGVGQFNKEAFVALDKVLEIANKKGVRVIIPFVDNWKWWGGVAEYAAFRDKPRDDFWTDKQLIKDFKKTIEFVVNRKNTFTGIKYKDDKAILAWETGNELVCPHSWTSEIAQYIKSLDENHLVLDGYHTRVLRDDSINDPYIDIVTTHHYEQNASKTISNIKKSLKKVGSKKPYFVGEFGFVPTDDFEKVLDTVIENDMSGLLIWSLRFRNSDSGFYRHSEPHGDDIYKAYRWPGFESGNSYDEKNLLKLMRKKAYEIQGIDAPPVKKPDTPFLLPIESPSCISFKGCAGATSYIIERSKTGKCKWQTVAKNVSDAFTAYQPIFNDTTVKRGQQFYYRVTAVNSAGKSEPSNVVGPVRVKYTALVDEMANTKLIHKMKGKINLETKQARKFKEDIHRIKAKKSSYIIYKLPEAINSFKIYSFFEKNISDPKFFLSSDGKNFKRTEPARQDFFSGEGDYSYAKPVLYTGYATIVGPRYLKVEFTTETQISRLEIRYGASEKVSHKKPPIDFVKGFSWGWTGWRGQYSGPGPKESVQKMADTGANWMCLAFGAEMETFDDPVIYYSDLNPRMVTDDEIIRAIGLARDNNMKIIFKPVVNVRDTTWRAWIKFNGIGGIKDMDKWNTWWGYFENMLVHYAKIAEEHNIEAFCLGCEMESTEEFETRWRTLIAKIREVYSGPITYNCNHGREDKVAWFDALDFISLSAYYPIGTDFMDLALNDDLSKVPASKSTVEKLKQRWKPIKKRLKNISKKFNKPMLFIELGVCSAQGHTAAPWTHHSKSAIYDSDEQARYYQATLETFWDEPWFMGFTWWAWLPNLYTPEQAKTHTGFSIYGKPAEDVVRKWYKEK